jgi:hypothetical protein
MVHVTLRTYGRDKSQERRGDFLFILPKGEVRVYRHYAVGVIGVSKYIN